MENAILLARMALQMFFSLMDMAERTDEEKERLYFEEKAKFDRNDPDRLKDFPV